MSSARRGRPGAGRDQGAAAEGGAATVLAVAATGVVVLALSGALVVSSALAAAGRARGAADLAALAAAERLRAGWAPPLACARAAAVAEANSAILADCQGLEGAEASVVVSVPVTLTLPGQVSANAWARARAGPPRSEGRIPQRQP